MLLLEISLPGKAKVMRPLSEEPIAVGNTGRADQFPPPCQTTSSVLLFFLSFVLLVDKYGLSSCFLF